MGRSELRPIRYSDRRMRSDRFLQLLRGAEGELLRSLDLDGFAGRGVAAHAGGALADDEDAQTVETDAGALLQVLGDQAGGVFEDAVGGVVGRLVLLGRR